LGFLLVLSMRQLRYRKRHLPKANKHWEAGEQVLATCGTKQQRKPLTL